MLYFLFTANSFFKSSIAEINGVAPKFKIFDRFKNIIIIETGEKSPSKELGSESQTFIYSAFKLLDFKKIRKESYLDDIYKLISKIDIPKDKTIKIECFDVNSKAGYSAKDIEVYLGNKLEKEDGFYADLKSPQILIYIVIINMKCYAGFELFSNLTKNFLNPSRYYKKYPTIISRAESKIREAFDEFPVKDKGIALDLGAAPGGWASFLVKHGFKVIAIDNANLEYGEFFKLDIMVKAITSDSLNSEKIKNYLKEFQILHIKSKANTLKLGLKNLDLITNDMNMTPKESANIVMHYSKNLKKGAKALMTVKCISRDADKYLADVKKILKEGFKIKGEKVLPNNRQELNLYAEKT